MSKPMDTGAAEGETRVANPAARSEREWKESLTPEQFRVLRKKGTERAFTGEYWDSKKAGMYVCAGCGQELFDAAHKFDSGTGWPSFDRPVTEGVDTAPDNGLLMRRTEALCSACGGHLGHMFSDGPPSTGERYCINSAALRLREDPAGGSDGIE
jgi:peptide-methionine (R)-S-oxide reductase